MHLRTNDYIFCCKLKSIHLKLLEDDFVILEVKLAAANEKGSRDSSMKNGCCLIKERTPSHNCIVCIYSYFFLFLQVLEYKCYCNECADGGHSVREETKRT